MNKYEKTVDEIIHRLRLSKEITLRISWDDFYKLTKKKRLHESYFIGLNSELNSRDVIMARGKRILAFTYDSAPNNNESTEEEK
jgi:hypothetical protein